MRLAGLPAFGLVLSLGLSSAAAAPPAAPQARSDAEVTRRLAFVESRLNRGSRAANLWWDVWYYGWTALTMGQFVFAIATPDPDTRIDMAVGAASSTLGVIPLGILPFPARTAPRDLARVSATTPEERRRKLAFAEHLLSAAAEDEALRRSWVNHATSIGVSIGAGLVLGVGYHHPVPGLLNAIGGIALSELQIFTQPTAAIGDFRDYQHFDDGAALPPPGLSRPRLPSPVGVSFAPHPGGLSISGWF